MERIVDAIDRARAEKTSPEAVFQMASRVIAERTGANRVSIWHFEEGGSRIRCDCFYEVNAGTFSDGQVLHADDHPTYFETIKQENFIVAPDARNHHVTSELTEPYFLEHDIYSLLDFIIHDNYRPTGVICCENAGARRDWSRDDISFLRQVSTLISFYFKPE